MTFKCEYNWKIRSLTPVSELFHDPIRFILETLPEVNRNKSTFPFDCPCVRMWVVVNKIIILQKTVVDIAQLLTLQTVFLTNTLSMISFANTLFILNSSLQQKSSYNKCFPPLVLQRYQFSILPFLLTQHYTTCKRYSSLWGMESFMSKFSQPSYSSPQNFFILTQFTLFHFQSPLFHFCSYTLSCKTTLFLHVKYVLDFFGHVTNTFKSSPS